MCASLFPTYQQTLREIDPISLEAEIRQPNRLLVDSSSQGGKRLDVAYAPFDYVVTSARIVIVGITPGRQQMRNALNELCSQLRAGRSDEDALSAAKVFASFSGPMRTNLVAMLDAIGLNRFLGLDTTNALWGSAAGLVHFTSALRYPVFVDGANYSGQPSMLRSPILRKQVERWLLAEMRQLPNAVYVPLGPKVSEVLDAISPLADIQPDQVLTGLPHPSGASAERIAYFLGRKSRQELSIKTNAIRLDAAREALLQKVSGLRKRALES